MVEDHSSRTVYSAAPSTTTRLTRMQDRQVVRHAGAPFQSGMMLLPTPMPEVARLAQLH